MDPDRASISRSGERPVTRWRRESDAGDKVHASTESLSSSTMRAYSKMERPTSRRGFKTDITEYGISRPPTSVRNTPSRPPSTTVLPNRASTAASVANSMSSAGLSRTHSGVIRNFVQPNAKIIDRPVMQQGLAGIPSASSKGHPRLLTRQIQDKRFQEQILQQRIRELNQEIQVISRQVEKENGRSDMGSDLYQQPTLDFNTELNKLQDQINEYHLAFNKITVGANKEQIMKEAKELKGFLEHEELEMQRIFQQREQTEKTLSDLNKEIQSKRNVAEKLLGDMSPEMKSKYDELIKQKTIVQKEMNKLQQQQSQLFTEKTMLQEKILTSSMKQEACKLYFKIIECERKRNKLLEQENDKHTLEDENNDENNVDSNTAQKQIIEIEKRIADAEKELEQLDVNSDENQSEKSMKNEENEKQADIMDIFISSAEKSKAEELEKLGHLEAEIIEHLELISDNINENVDNSILKDDEMEILKVLMNQNIENRSEKSFEELKRDNKKLQQILSKLRSLESKIKVGSSDRSYNDITDYQSIKDDRYKKLEEKIKENEIYRFISILEDKIDRITISNEAAQKPREEQAESDKDDYSLLLKKLTTLTSQYNAYLISEMKTIY